MLKPLLFTTAPPAKVPNAPFEKAAVTPVGRKDGLFALAISSPPLKFTRAAPAPVMFAAVATMPSVVKLPAFKFKLAKDTELATRPNSTDLPVLFTVPPASVIVVAMPVSPNEMLAVGLFRTTDPPRIVNSPLPLRNRIKSPVVVNVPPATCTTAMDAAVIDVPVSSRGVVIVPPFKNNPP